MELAKAVRFDKVFVHTAEMGLKAGKYEFLPNDKHGFLHGEIRVEAAKILIKQKRVGQIIVVGGPTEDGASKARMMAKMISKQAIPLESIRSTQGNIEAIKDYFTRIGHDNKRNGFLTHFYHLPRTKRLISENGFNLIPIAAEAVLLTDSPRWMEQIRNWYSDPSMLKRILSEIQGLAFLEDGRHHEYISEYG